MFGKLMAKKQKEGKELDPMYKDSKMSMLQSLKDEMSGMMKGDLSDDGMKKVEVGASSPEGLVEGLDTAKDMVKPDEPIMPESPEVDEVHSAIGEYLESPSKESIDSLIACLNQKKMGME